MRLGLTTTLERIHTLQEGVSLLGFEPIALPCIRVDTAPDGANQLAAVDADALVVTSARAASLLLREELPPIPIVAVGPETATTFEKAGTTVAWVGSGGVREIALDARHLLSGRNVLLAGAANTSRENAAVLEMAGGSVTRVELYTTVPVAPEGDPVDAVVFGSPTAVTGWFMSRQLQDLVIGAIGPTTAAALGDHDVIPDVVPDRPGFMRTIEQLAALRPERSTQ